MSISVWGYGIRGKMFGLIVVPLITLVLLSAVFLQKLSDSSDSISYMTLIRIPSTMNTERMIGQIHAILRFSQGIFISTSQEEILTNFKKTQENIELLRNLQVEFDKLPHSGPVAELYKSVEPNLNQFIMYGNEFINLIKKNEYNLSLETKILLNEKIYPLAASVETGLRKMQVERVRITKEIGTKTEADNSSFRFFIIFSGISFAFLFLVFGLYIVKKLSTKLLENTSRLLTSSEKTMQSSDKMRTASQTISSGATESAASLEQTVSSLEQLSSMVKQNANNAREVNSLAQIARKSAEEGEAEILGLCAAMNDVAEASKRVNEIIGVIDSIAFQTNLLALNAAVEAARAGEQGKGFAVVAEAVRNLAQRSASAAKDITHLIRETVEKSDKGVVVASHSAETLKHIVANSKKVSDLITEIANASNEQAQGISQISKAMNQLDQVTQANAGIAEQSLDISLEMTTYSKELTNIIYDLLLIIKGKNDGNSVVKDFKQENSYKVLNQKSKDGSFGTQAMYSLPSSSLKKKKGGSSSHLYSSSQSNLPSIKSSAQSQNLSNSHTTSEVQSSKKSAKQVIPFDSDQSGFEDDTKPNVGTIQGF